MRSRKQPAIPRMLELAERLYAVLYEESSNMTWEGSMVAAYDKTKASRTHYKRLYDLLEEMGSISVERKGRRDLPTRIQLLKPPDLDEYVQAKETLENRLTQMDAAAMLRLEQRVEQLEGRLQGIDITSALLDIEKRLQILETGESKNAA